MPEECVLPDFDEKTAQDAASLYAVLDRDLGYAIERFNEAPEDLLRVLYAMLTHDPDRPGHVEQKDANAFWADALCWIVERRGIVFNPCKCVAART